MNAKTFIRFPRQVRAVFFLLATANRRAAISPQ